MLSPSCFNTAPTPNPDASVSIIYGRPNLGGARIGAVVIAVFRRLNASSHLSLHVNGVSFLVNSVKGAATWAYLSMNRRKNDVIPMKARTSFTSLGVGYLSIAQVFSGFGLIPCSLRIKPRNFTSG
uniref:Uncharacterized protein n=1 Tax=Heterorhabditis bacteriophora TaxID=37862 RepID=A0A1I7W760_HETBA